MYWSYPIVWAVFYNSYFGWNFHPQSPEELICDGIFVLMAGMVFYSWRKK